MITKKVRYGNKVLLVFLSMIVLLSVVGVNLKAEESISPAAAGDIASSTVTRYPITYGNVAGTALYEGYGRYQFNIFGNSNTAGFDARFAGLAPTANVYIDEDNDATTFSSTSMDYQQDGTVVKAYLYIAESNLISKTPPSKNRAETYILGPKGDKFYFDDGYADAVYDITDFVKSQGPGTYWGKNIESERNINNTYDNYANWEIQVIEEKTTLPYRKVSLRGHNIQMQRSNVTLNASNTPFAMPNNGSFGGQITITAAGGNASVLGGSASSYASINSLQNGSVIKNAIVPSGIRGIDLFQSRITVDGTDILTRNPDRIPANIDLITDAITPDLVDPNADNVQLYARTEDDMIWLHMLGIAANVGVPEIALETHIDNLGVTDHKFQIGDVITVNNTLAPNPNETKFFLANPVITIQLPANARYILNSASSIGISISHEEYDAQTGILKIYLSDTIEDQPVELSYQVQSNDGLRVSNIQTSLQGDNQVLTDITDMSLTFNSNDVTLTPSYPVLVNHIDERTGSTILQETLKGLNGDSFTAMTATFTGLSFNPSANNSPKAGAFTDDHQVVNLYYTANLYMMNFYVNNGDSANPVSQQIAFENFATKPTDPTREGYIFIGWNTLADGSGINWDFANTTMPANDVTLYAQWDKKVEPVIDYTLTFDLNGGQGTAPADQTLNEGQKAVKPTNPTREGYTFKGWNTAQEGSGTTWNFETNTMPANDVTLYAQWNKNDLPITGDSSNAVLFSTLLVLAGVSLIVVSKKRYLKQ